MYYEKVDLSVPDDGQPLVPTSPPPDAPRSTTLSPAARDRRDKEIDALIKDSKTMRQLWRSVGTAIAQRVATRTPMQFDKNGEPTHNSLVEEYSYNALVRDLDNLRRDDGQPTELEMLLQCQMVHARHDTAAAVFIRDTLGAKPVDESKTEVSVTNPYEQMSDEELEWLAARRKAVECGETISPLDGAAIVPLRDATLDDCVASVTGDTVAVDAAPPREYDGQARPQPLTHNTPTSQTPQTPGGET